MYDRCLFAVAASWNLIAAAMLLFRPRVMLTRLGITDPAARFLAQSFVSSVATWGIAYGMIAWDPVRFRDFAWLGLLSKTIFFLIYAVAHARGRLTRQAFLPGLLDLILALLFFEFLWRTAPH
jgi:hypothetical protein